jgi:Protein of unknown function (DUF3995)
MIFTIGLFVSLIFSFLSGLHFYWGIGGQWGAAEAVPSKENGEKVLNPQILACFVVGFGLLFLAILVACKSNLVAFELPFLLSAYALWVVAGLFALRAMGDFRYVGFFKTIKKTTFGRLDSLYYSPLCLLLAFLIAYLQWKS